MAKVKFCRIYVKWKVNLDKSSGENGKILVDIGDEVLPQATMDNSPPFEVAKNDSVKNKPEKVIKPKKKKPLEKLLEADESESEKTPKKPLKLYKGPFVTLQVPKFLMVDINKKRKSDLYVITLAKQLLKYVTMITQKAPKKFRFTYVSRLQNFVLEILENLFKAQQFRVDIQKTYEMRNLHQREAYTKLKLLSYFCYVAFENGCILEKHYRHISQLVHNCLGYLVKWMQSDKDRLTAAKR